MHERDYPKFSSFHRPEPYDDGFQSSAPVHSKEAWTQRLAEIDQAQAADIERAIEDAASLRMDVHLYRKIGSHFLGIGFEEAHGSSVKVFEYPEIKG